MKSYKSIKWILKKHLASKEKLLWNWIQGKNEEFICLYLSIDDKLKIYTAQQLLDAIEEKQKKEKNGKTEE